MIMARHSALSSWKIPPDRLSIAHGLVRLALKMPSNILVIILLELIFYAWKLTMMFHFTVIFTSTNGSRNRLRFCTEQSSFVKVCFILVKTKDDIGKLYSIGKVLLY